MMEDSDCPTMGKFAFKIKWIFVFKNLLRLTELAYDSISTVGYLYLDLFLKSRIYI